MMFKIAIMTLILATPGPLGLDWGQKLKDIPEIEQYRYWYGDIHYGSAVYLGNTDILEMQTEIVLQFAGNRIAKATLILGPSGINEANCSYKYKEVNSLLEKKYGKHTNKILVKDPLMEDLLYYRECYALSLGLQEMETIWKLDGYTISSSVFGDDGEIFIEIEYANKFLSPKLKKENEKKTLKRL